MPRNKGRFYWIAWQYHSDGKTVFCASSDGAHTTRDINESYLFPSEPTWIEKRNGWKTFKVMVTRSK